MLRYLISHEVNLKKAKTKKFPIASVWTLDMPNVYFKNLVVFNH